MMESPNLEIIRQIWQTPESHESQMKKTLQSSSLQSLPARNILSQKGPDPIVASAETLEISKMEACIWER